MTAPTSASSNPTWFEQRQQQAWQDYERLPAPAQRDEHWRYSSAKKLDLSGRNPAPEPTAEQVQAALAASSGIEGEGPRLVFVNDRLVQQCLDGLPEGSLCLSLEQALKSHADLLQQHGWQSEASMGSEKFAALHLAQQRAAVVLLLPKGVEMTRPLEVIHWCVGRESVIFPHLLVIAQAHSHARVSEQFRSLMGDAAMLLAMTRLVAADAGRISYSCLQQLAGDAQGLQQAHLQCGREARITALQVQLGAQFSRCEMVSDLDGAGARSEMFSVSLPMGTQMVDQRTLQRHRAPNASSDLLFKNALYDQAQSVFSGLIVVDEGAHATDAYQTCRNLLASDQAQAHSLPGLEILADQVKCSHGSTSGPMDAEELFYLRARGIDEALARQLIARGFVAQVISRLGDEAWSAALLKAVDEKLEARA